MPGEPKAYGPAEPPVDGGVLGASKRKPEPVEGGLLAPKMEIGEETALSLGFEVDRLKLKPDDSGGSLAAGGLVVCEN